MYHVYVYVNAYVDTEQHDVYQKVVVRSCNYCVLCKTVLQAKRRQP